MSKLHCNRMLLALGMGFLMSSPSHADELNFLPPVTPLTDSWSGGYFGGQISQGSIEVSSDDIDESGLLYGVHFGLLADLGRFVTGLEVDYNRTNISFEDGSDLEAVGRLKLKVGFDAGRVLPYFTIGGASGVISLGDEDESTQGSFFGFGASYAVSPTFMIGAEALHHNFEDVFGVVGADAEATTFGLQASYRF